MPISYKLAKQLKEAGFPQKKPLFYDYTRKEKYKIPTLSELIEACGNKFGSLTRFKNIKTGKAFWVANDLMEQVGENSNSPEEAVAKLWLELKKGQNQIK